tara:strand:- start:769 stop:1794 length:1026 start_codon:yes stop_codon:yes gene_type:complete
MGSKLEGGAEINLRNYIEELQERGNNFICLSDYLCLISNQKNINFNFIRRIPFLLIIYSIILYILRKKSSNVSNIHVHSNGYQIFLGYIIAFLTRTKLIIKVTRIGKDTIITRDKGSYIKQSKFQKLRSKLFSLIRKSKIVKIHYLTETAYHFDNYSRQKLLCPNITKPPKYERERPSLGNVVICSRFIKRKNIDKTLDQLLNLEYPINKIFIIGDGPLFNTFQLKYSRYEEIIFLGKVSNEKVKKIYSKAEFYINLSDSEGMSNSTIEALAYGCKVILSNIPENYDTGGKFAIYQTLNGENLTESFKLASKLNHSEISEYAYKRFVSKGSIEKYLNILYS